MNRRQIEGRRPVIEALRAGRKIGEIFVASGSKTSGALAEIVRLAERKGISLREIPRRDLDSRARSRNAQGVIAMALDFTYVEPDDLDGTLFVALDGITDPQNVGAIARSAEAAGADGLIVPRRRAAPVTATAEKASAGALEHLPVAQVPNLVRALGEFQKRGVWIVALDAGAERTIYDLDVADHAVCLVVGSEEKGVSRLVHDRADELVRIPMSGRVESLNAAAACAVALFEIKRTRDA